MIRMFLTGLFFGGLYLWGLENCRLLCGVLWLVAPLVMLLLYGIIEAKQEERGF